MTTRTWKVHGADGHRQRESFAPSHINEFARNGECIILEVENSDKTGTNEYSVVRITRNTAEECEQELWRQISDGVFAQVLNLRLKRAKGKKLEKWEREYWNSNRAICALRTKLSEEEQAEKDRIDALLG